MQTKRVRKDTSPAGCKERAALRLVNQPLSRRDCLACQWTFYSTGIDHRLCNMCKGIPRSTSTIMGERIASAPTRRERQGRGQEWL